MQQIATVKKEIDQGRDKSKHKTIFHQLLDPNASEGHVVPDVEALTEEMFTVLTAGGETAGHALAMTTYYVLSNPEIHQKLVSELKTAFPNKKAGLEYLTLEKLPYLACVQGGPKTFLQCAGALAPSNRDPRCHFQWLSRA